MEVNTNYSAGGVNGPTPPSRTSRPATSAAAADGDDFAGTSALNQAMRNTPEVRPDAVSRAQNLINDPNYPSTDALRQIANLLANKISSGGE